MTDLLPCPFCGGEAHTLLDIDKYAVGCDNDICLGFIGLSWLYDTEAEAIAAWNTRAELGSEPPYDELLRCLENDWHIRASWDGLRKFWCIELTEEGVRLRDGELNTRAERTCRIVEYDKAPFLVCSECGAVQPDDYTVYYCWNCGAKVVSE